MVRKISVVACIFFFNGIMCEQEMLLRELQVLLFLYKIYVIEFCLILRVNQKLNSRELDQCVCGEKVASGPLGRNKASSA